MARSRTTRCCGARATHHAGAWRRAACRCRGRRGCASSPARSSAVTVSTSGFTPERWARSAGRWRCSASLTGAARASTDSTWVCRSTDDELPVVRDRARRHLPHPDPRPTGCSRFLAADVCAVEHLRPTEVFDSAQARHNGMVITVDDPVRRARRAGRTSGPLLGDAGSGARTRAARGRARRHDPRRPRGLVEPRRRTDPARRRPAAAARRRPHRRPRRVLRRAVLVAPARRPRRRRREGRAARR